MKTVKLTTEQIEVIERALNCQYYETLNEVNKANDESTKRFWAVEFKNLTETIQTLFDQTYER